MRESKVRLILSFIEGVTLTWNPFTMALSVAFGFLDAIANGFNTTPLRNAFFLLGAFVGWLASYLTGNVSFYMWGGIWWMPTGLVVAAAIGIPLTWRLRKREVPTGF